MAWNRCLQQNTLNRKNLKRRYKSRLSQINNTSSRTATKALLRAIAFLKYVLFILTTWLTFPFCLIYNGAKLLPIWLIELFRFCPQKNIPSKPFYIIGHRGSAAKEIENTLPSFAKALQEDDANAIEIDICFTRDKQVVLWHDWDPESIVTQVRKLGLEPHVAFKPFIPDHGPGSKAVSRMDLEQLRKYCGYSLKKRTQRVDAHIPTFQEALDWFSKNTAPELIILDIKTPEAEKALLDEMIPSILKSIAKFNLPTKFIFISPAKAIIKRIQKLTPETSCALDIELPLAIVLDPHAFSSIQSAINIKANDASVGRPTILQLGPWTTLRRILQFDKHLQKKYKDTPQNISRLITWTINKPREMKCLIKLGIDGIITDKPDILSRLYHKTGKN